jgi:hypothetical protein
MVEGHSGTKLIISSHGDQEVERERKRERGRERERERERGRERQGRGNMSVIGRVWDELYLSRSFPH